jgi:hypothetical protein
VAEPAQQQSEEQTAGQSVCPECGRTFTRPQALGAHRRQAHGIAGSSRNTAGARTKRRASKTGAGSSRGAATAPSTAAGTRSTRTRGRRSTAAAEQPGVDRDALLQTLFPDGIPAREEVIRALNAWLDEAQRLATMR